MSSPTLEVDGLAFGYPGSSAPLFVRFDLSVDSGQMIAVQGRSGAGKSTLLFLLGLFIAPTGGGIAISGRQTAGLADAERSRLRAHHIGFVFQDAILHAAMTIEQNVAEGGLYGGMSYEAAVGRARELLEIYGISELARRWPTKISGGQAQRAALCRALMRRPALVLADEPTGNLDPDNAAAVVAGLRAAADQGAAVVVVTHSPSIAAACDRAVWLG